MSAFECKTTEELKSMLSGIQKVLDSRKNDTYFKQIKDEKNKLKRKIDKKGFVVDSEHLLRDEKGIYEIELEVKYVVENISNDPCSYSDPKYLFIHDISEEQTNGLARYLISKNQIPDFSDCVISDINCYFCVENMGDCKENIGNAVLNFYFAFKTKPGLRFPPKGVYYMFDEELGFRKIKSTGKYFTEFGDLVTKKEEWGVEKCFYIKIS